MITHPDFSTTTQADIISTKRAYKTLANKAMLTGQEAKDKLEWLMQWDNDKRKPYYEIYSTGTYGHYRLTNRIALAFDHRDDNNFKQDLFPDEQAAIKWLKDRTNVVAA